VQSFASSGVCRRQSRLGRDEAPLRVYWFTKTAVLARSRIVRSLVRVVPRFYGTRRFITIFTRNYHWCLPWGHWNQFTRSILNLPVICTTLLRSNIASRWHILGQDPHIRGLPSCLFLSGFQTLYTYLVSPSRSVFPHFIPLMHLSKSACSTIYRIEHINHRLWISSSSALSGFIVWTWTSIDSVRTGPHRKYAILKARGGWQEAHVSSTWDLKWPLLSNKNQNNWQGMFSPLVALTVSIVGI
jgi:hypothetical protein